LGTVHVSNDAEGVRTGIRQMQQNRSSLQKEIAALQRMHREDWLSKSQQLLELIAI
jgi:hypothetical protein